jgi:hypothetical protein
VGNRPEVLVASIIVRHDFSVVTPHVLNRVVAPPYVLRVPAHSRTCATTQSFSGSSRQWVADDIHQETKRGEASQQAHPPP